MAPGPGAEVVAATAHPFGVRGALELARLAREAKPDLVHCPHFPTPASIHVPLVVTLHDLAPLLVPGVMPSAAKRAVYRRWNARAVRLADRVVVPSRATAADVERLFPAARNKLEVIAEAVDDFSDGPIGPLSGAVAHLASQPYLLSMGNTKLHKDLPTLLLAFSELAHSIPDLRLLLVGAEPSGYLDAGPAGVAAETRSRVAFTGRVDDTELRALYAGAAAFVFPSQYEGFGLPPLEAMASGTPVIVSNSSSIPEVVGDAGLLVDPFDQAAIRDAMLRLIDDKALCATLAARGIDRARGFSWARCASTTREVYERVLSER